MKIRRVIVNNRKAQIELVTHSGRMLPFPFVKLRPRPTARNRIRSACVDPELGNEAITYVLASGAEGSVHVEHALEYNQDPSYMRELLAHKLTLKAIQRLERAGLSRREVARRLRTSVPQLYRLLDPARPRKPLGQLVELLSVLDCDVDVVIRPRQAA